MLARALEISWATTMKLLLLHAGVNGSSRQQLDITFANFFRLRPETGATALKFYRMREKAGEKVQGKTFADERARFSRADARLLQPLRQKAGKLLVRACPRHRPPSEVTPVFPSVTSTPIQ